MPVGPHGAARDARQYARAAIRSRRRSRPGAVAGVTLLVAAAVVGVLVVTNRPGTGPALSPAAFVRQSAQRTLAQQTADMTLSMSLQFAGQSVTLNGTGELNFSTGAMALDMEGGPAGQQVDMKEILVNGTLYVAFSVNGQSPPGFGGNTWTELKVPGSGSGNWDNGNPYTMLPQLERQGITLRPLGTKAIGGVTCTGYAVTPPAGEGSPVTITVWADSKQLVREMTASVQMDGIGTSAHVTMDFFGFGTPVHITAPSPDTTYTA
jgi:hypothetical protein